MKAIAIIFSFTFISVSHLLADELSKAQAAFSKADLGLNTLWAELKAGFTPEEFAKLRESQRAWLEYRDYVADFQMAPGSQGDPKKQMKDVGYLETAAGMTEARVDFLRSWKDTADGNKTGSWTDSYGGRIKIVEKDAKLFFELMCVRGPTFHTGSLSGIAEKNGDLARYSDREDAPEKAKEFGETWLNFEFNGDGTLEVAAANSQHYHGARAFFEGGYRRTASLDAKARASVEKAAVEGIEE